MNVIASVFFVIPAAAIYKKKKTLPFAVVGLACGVLGMTASMILWNWLITPMYTGMPREAIVPMLPTIFLPFNLIKAGINMALTLMIYKPISIILHKSGLLETKKDAEETEIKEAKKFSFIPIIIGLAILGACIGMIILFKVNAVPA